MEHRIASFPHAYVPSVPTCCSLSRPATNRPLLRPPVCLPHPQAIALRRYGDWDGLCRSRERWARILSW